MKVCIIGNNLTGLILAYILSKKKFKCKIYSTNNKKSKFATRSLGITDYNLNYLQNYFKNIKKKTNPINEIKVLIENKKVKEKILFKKDSKILFNMIKYDDLSSYIKSKVNKNKYISFKNIKDEKTIYGLLQNNKFDFIINCEKKNILTKNYLQKGIFKNYFNKAFTTIIKHKDVKNNIATQIFTEFGPVAYLPLSKKLTSVVFSFDLKNRSEISELDILNLIKKYNPLYNIVSHNKIENFELNLILPKKYFYKEILFFGDSIHSIHPLAGQGFNMTIRDMIKFDEILEKKISLGLEINKNIYKEFETKVKSNNSAFAIGIDLVHEFFNANKILIPKKISKNIFSFINKNKKIKDVAINLANSGNL
tara:strand:- start:89 stop:1186 length:1098 start_codon:yes stop_codon:yes gene_type:complete